MRRSLRSPRSVTPRIARLLSFLGCALSVHTAPAAAQVPAAVPPSRGGHLAPPPWSGVSANPPLALTRARVTPPPLRHPAVHPVGATAAHSGPLFPRAEAVLRQKRERQDAMRRHPAGKGLARRSSSDGGAVGATRALRPDREAPGRSDGAVAHEIRQCGSSNLRVRPGDSLWSIAASIVDPTSTASVARLSQRIFEANRGVIGADPDLIHPGQSLSVPKDCAR